MRACFSYALSSDVLQVCRRLLSEFLDFASPVGFPQPFTLHITFTRKCYVSECLWIA